MKSVFLAVILTAVLCISGNLWAYSGGDGLSDETAYQISSPADWQELMATSANWGNFFILTQDIDLSGIVVTPVGNSDYPFYGVFNGNSHTISNAVINQPGDYYVGLFGRIYGTISNLGADDIAVTGYSCVGGLVGESFGGILSGCFATGTVTGTSLVGGLVGSSSYGSLENCYAKVTVSGDSEVGGLVGGDQNSSITHCFSTGLVSGYSDTGGLVGWSWKANRVTTECFWDTDTSGKTDGVGSIDPDPAGVMGRTTADMKTQTTFTDAGWDFADDDGDAADWKMQPNDYPHLQWEIFGLKGQGTETDPYIISSINDFLIFTDVNNAGLYWISGVYIRLEKDLDLQGISFAPIGGTYDDGQGGTVDLYFAATFDGNSHKLSHVSIDAPDRNYVGLFGYIAAGGKVSRLGVENVNISGQSNVGGLAGYNHGTLEYCYTTGQVAGSYSSGGLMGGCDQGTTTSCYAACTVSGGDVVGGLAGYCSFSTITNSYSTGSISGNQTVGGLVAYSIFNTITHCYSAGSVNGNSFTGGLIGLNNYGTITSCFWDRDTSNQTTSAAGTEMTTAQMKIQSNYTGWDFEETWFMPYDNYPRLLWESRYVGQGTADNPYQIRSTTDWQMFMTVPSDWDKFFILTADLDFTGINLTPVAPDTIASTDYLFEGTRFTGTFDGQGHTLRHAVITLPGQDFVGLFGSIGADGRIENLNLEDISVTGRLSVGSLAGENYTGTIIHCTTNGTVNGSYWHCGGLVGESHGGLISQCSVKGTVNGANWVGGLAGYLHSDGAINSCSAAATVDGTSIVGGLVGIEENWGSYIMDSYATGIVTATTTQAGGLVGRLVSGYIQQCYSTDDVFCPANAGGLLGYNVSGSGTLTDLFWNTETCHLTVGVGGGNSAGVTGKTTAQMKMLSTFPWNFTSVWAICEQTNYPRLRWRIPAGDFVCPDGVAVEDLQHFASQWLAEDCAASNNCQGADLNNTTSVNLTDFAIFADHWLEGV